MLWSTERDFIHYLTKKTNQSIGLLGPAGTSSDYVISRMLQGDQSSLIRKVLIDHFDQIYESLLHGRVDIVMIPAAYNMVTKFFWAAEFELIGSVVKKTPDYHLCKAQGKEHLAIISSCDAVSHMLEHDFKDHLNGSYQVVRAASTAEAAEMLYCSQVDACITNDNSKRKNRLHTIATVNGVDMVWLFFRKKI